MVESNLIKRWSDGPAVSLKDTRARVARRGRAARLFVSRVNKIQPSFA